MASPRFSYWPVTVSVIHKWSTSHSRRFGFPFCKWRENAVPATPIKPPFLISLCRLGDRMGRVLMSHCTEPSILSNFSVFFRGRRQASNPPVTGVRDMGVPFDTAFTSSVHYLGAIQGLSDLSQAVFVPLYCVIVWPHQEYAMEDFSESCY